MVLLFGDCTTSSAATVAAICLPGMSGPELSETLELCASERASEHTHTQMRHHLSFNASLYTYTSTSLSLNFSLGPTLVCKQDAALLKCK